jgi:hypothetical protein
VAFVFLIVFLIHGSSSAFRTIFFIDGILVANESEWGFLFLAWNLSSHNSETLDVSVLLENFSESSLIPVEWEVFDVNVIECLSDFSSVFWLIWDHFPAKLFAELYGL